MIEGTNQRFEGISSPSTTDEIADAEMPPLPGEVPTLLTTDEVADEEPALPGTNLIE